MTGLCVLLAGMALPPLLTGLDRSRARAAARYLGARLALARAQAVSRGAVVGLRFDTAHPYRPFATYRDGNGDGLRAGDILAGIDPLVDSAVSLPEMFPGVTMAMDMAGETGEAVQVGPSGIISFTPIGTSSPGSVYLRGRDGSQYVVRVFGATGRTRVLRYSETAGDFIEEL